MARLPNPVGAQRRALLVVPMLLVTAAAAQTGLNRVREAPVETTVGVRPVTLQVYDYDGRATYFHISFTHIGTGVVYPKQSFSARRGPDQWFQEHVYRQTGDRMLLPAGSYRVEVGRGPEYRTEQLLLEVTPGGSHAVVHRLKRWVDPAASGWYSGDHHVHGSGCFGGAASETSKNVMPEHLIPHLAGEGLNVAELLLWFYGWNELAQRFRPTIDPSSTAERIIKLGIETSGFGPVAQGHYCLLGLNQLQYPGSIGTSAWPGSPMPILRWAKSQGAVTGHAHAGVGLGGLRKVIPNYDLPPLHPVGASALFTHVTDPANVVDFFGVVDGNYYGEMNAWYHLQNAGFRIKISGESDFPCIGRRVGMGRTYVAMSTPSTPLGYDQWLAGLALGRSYVSEGHGHLMDFAVNGLGVGRASSEVNLAGPRSVRVTCRAAAYLEPRPQPPAWIGWSIERARTNGRKVPVEIIVNGLPVHSQLIEADGTAVTIDQTVVINKSSWVGVRIPNSAHTNSIYVLVGGEPVRASADSARWCRDLSERYWQRFSQYIPSSSRIGAWIEYSSSVALYDSIVAESSIGPFAATEKWGQGCPGTSGPMQIDAIGAPQLGNSGFQIRLTGVPPGTFPTLLGSVNKASLLVGGCELLLDAPVAFPGGQAGPTGVCSVPVPVPDDPVFEGLELYFQWRFQTGSIWTTSYRYSDALTVHFSGTLAP